MANQGNKKEISTSYTHEQLLAALYFIWDAAERGQLDMFLIGETAKQVKEGKDLSGEMITVGVRKNEWINGQGRITEGMLYHEIGKPVYLDDGDKVIYHFKDVPIEMSLYEENPCLKSFDIVFYGYETFNLPNPYEEFVKKYE